MYSYAIALIFTELSHNLNKMAYNIKKQPLDKLIDKNIRGIASCATALTIANKSNTITYNSTNNTLTIIINRVFTYDNKVAIYRIFEYLKELDVDTHNYDATEYLYEDLERTECLICTNTVFDGSKGVMYCPQCGHLTKKVNKDDMFRGKIIIHNVLNTEHFIYKKIKNHKDAELEFNSQVLDTGFDIIIKTEHIIKNKSRFTDYADFKDRNKSKLYEPLKDFYHSTQFDHLSFDLVSCNLEHNEDCECTAHAKQYFEMDRTMRNPKYEYCIKCGNKIHINSASFTCFEKYTIDNDTLKKITQ